jgi:tetratricopeptide (TPR) repeat protein
MRTRKQSIAEFIWIIFVIAAGLTIAVVSGPGVRWLAPFGIVLGLALGLAAMYWFWFIFIPMASLKLAGNNPDRQRRILQCVVNTPSPGSIKILARFLLASNNQVATNYAEAEALYRSILLDAAGDLDPGFESVVRQHLADTVEAMGCPEEAAAERKEAAASLRGTEETVLGLQAQGKLLQRDHRYAEAYATFERALAIAPARPKAVRSELMMHLVLSSFNAGRSSDTVRWAEAVIEYDPQGAVIDMARRMAAVGCSNMGRLDDAERHVRVAIELAPTAQKRAESLALLGDYVMRRGNLDEAVRIAREAEALLPGQKRLPWIVIGGVAKERGHLEDAIRAFEHANTISMGHIPAMNRRAAAAIQKDLAVMYAELGRADTARALIHEAERELAGDPKLSITLDASAALVHALLHERDLALARMAAAEERRKTLPGDSGTHRAALYLLGRAALLLDDPECCEHLFRAYLELKPDPLYHPYAYYHLAECRHRLGDLAGAQELDTKAASTHFGTRWERLASERLASVRATATS